MGNQRITFDSLEGRGMTMAIKDLIRSSWKPHAVLGDVDQGEIGTGKGDIARSIHEASAGPATSNLRLWEALDTGLGNPGAAIF